MLTVAYCTVQKLFLELLGKEVNCLKRKTGQKKTREKNLKADISSSTA